MILDHLISTDFNLLSTDFNLLSEMLTSEKKLDTIEDHHMLTSEKKKLDTIEDHHNKRIIDDQCCSWDTSLKNCLCAVFEWRFNNASYILGN